MTKKTKPIVMIPFDLSGSVPRRARTSATGYSFKENFKFEDTLRCTQAKQDYVIFTSVSTKRKYPMSRGDFFRMVKSQTIKMGYIRGEWTFHKHGNCYSIRIISASKFEIMV